MKTIDILEEVAIALSANKARSGLTILGIVIGISSVIAMLSIGQGAQQTITDRIQSIGANLVLVTPGAQRGPGTQVSSGRGSAKSLTLEDSDAIANQISNISGVAPEATGRYQVTAKGTNTNTSVVGTVPAYTTVRNLEIDDGTFVTDANVRNGAKVAVIGPTVRDDLFGAGAYAIGQTIRIKKIEFKIIGLTKSKGASGFGSQDDMIFIPISTAQRFLTGDQYVSTISIAAADANSTTQVQADTTTLLLARHHITNAALADFSTMNQADIAATATSVTSILTILLGSVAGISLVVGGIGIMNMMLTTVTERTREIGLRKSIGAKPWDISRQFLFEAMALTFIGGLVGIFLGWLVAFFMTYLNILQTQVTTFSIVLAFSVSAAIGIVFGYYPAQRAARLNPIEALRYE
jgi:putative ABC transport system permease protein